VTGPRCLTRLDPSRLALLVARAGGGACRFAEPVTIVTGSAILIRIAFLRAVAFEIPPEPKILCAPIFCAFGIPAGLKISAAAAIPAPAAAVAEPRFGAGLQMRFQVGTESGFQFGLHVLEARLAAALAARRVVVRLPP
jgi:hypothetical protein